MGRRAPVEVMPPPQKKILDMPLLTTTLTAEINAQRHNGVINSDRVSRRLSHSSHDRYSMHSGHGLQASAVCTNQRIARAH